jgi:hypothetical protein
VPWRKWTYRALMPKTNVTIIFLHVGILSCHNTGIGSAVTIMFKRRFMTAVIKI